jgi:hypothetical protein
MSDSAGAKASGDGFDSIRRFVQRVLDASQASLSVHGVALEWGVRIELTAALLEAAKPESQARPGADLLGDILDGAAKAAQLGEGAAPAAVV